MKFKELKACIGRRLGIDIRLNKDINLFQEAIIHVQCEIRSQR